jgi:antitoxin component of RelBE/YafQ-DinJ toxin-antitoxin module
VRTYYVSDMNLTLSIDDGIVQQARRRAEAMGKSVNQLVREYLEQFAGKSDLEAAADEYREMARNPKGNSRGWKFNREELHERR